eukprot:Nk52_evm49s252 gene=Nk52_evmTU49s252
MLYCLTWTTRGWGLTSYSQKMSGIRAFIACNGTFFRGYSQEGKGDSEGSEDMGKGQSLLKKYFKRFLMGVHPDLFRNSPEAAKINNESLSTVNSLFFSENAFKNEYDKKDQLFQLNVKLNFFVKGKEENDKLEKFDLNLSLGALSKQYSKGNQEEFAAIVQKEEGEWLASAYMYYILELARADIDEEDQRIIDEVVVKWGGLHGKDPIDEMKRRTQRRHPLEDMFREELLRNDHAVRLADLVESDKIFFNNELSLEEKAFAARNFEQNIHRMSYFTWSHVKVVVSREYSKEAGHCCVPFDFNVQEFKHFMKQNFGFRP